MTSKNLPQTYDQMIADGESKKQNRLYKAQSSEFVDGQITDLVTLAAEELARIADATERVRLADVDTVKRRTIIYIRACADSSTIPTFSGLARSMGLSTEALYKHMRTNPDSETSQWLQIVHDQFADTLATAALRNMTNSIVSIFSLKARSGWKETIALEPVAHDVLGPQTPPEDLEAYLAAIDGED